MLSGNSWGKTTDIIDIIAQRMELFLLILSTIFAGVSAFLVWYSWNQSRKREREREQERLEQERLEQERLEREREQLDVLCWPGLDKSSFPKLYEDFEKDQNVDIHTEPYDQRGPINYLDGGVRVNVDVIETDWEWMRQVSLNPNERISLVPLQQHVVEFANDSLLAPLKEFIIRDGNQVYAIPLRFGVNVIAYNTKHVVPEALYSYDVVFENLDFNAKIGVWDNWRPMMGLISKYLSYKEGSSLYNNTSPYQLNKQQLDEVCEKIDSLHSQDPLMFKGENVAETMKNYLSSGRMWVALGGAEHLVPNESMEGGKCRLGCTEGRWACVG